MMLFFVIAMVMNLVNYWFSDKIVLKMYGAKGSDGQGSSGAVQRHSRTGVERADCRCRRFI